MSSHYPPGVTGNEPAIAGPQHEFDAERKCGMEVKIRNISDPAVNHITDALNKLRPMLIHVNQLGSQATSVNSDVIRVLYRGLYSALGSISDGWEASCPFEGEVSIEVQDCTEYWRCPLCGYDHEHEAPEPED